MRSKEKEKNAFTSNQTQATTTEAIQIMAYSSNRFSLMLLYVFALQICLTTKNVYRTVLIVCRQMKGKNESWHI